MPSQCRTINSSILKRVLSPADPLSNLLLKGFSSKMRSAKRSRCLPYILRVRRGAKAVAIMRRVEVVEGRPRGHDTGRVDVPLAVVARFDFMEVEGVLDSRPLIELAQVVGEIRIVLDAADVALEMAIVDEIETQQRRKGAPVGLGDALADEVAALVETLLQGVQPIEYFPHRLIVSLLGLGEAGTVNAVVQMLVDEIVHLIDFIVQPLWIEIEAGVRPRIEGRVDHPDDFG